LGWGPQRVEPGLQLLDEVGLLVPDRGGRLRRLRVVQRHARELLRLLAERLRPALQALADRVALRDELILRERPGGCARAARDHRGAVVAVVAAAARGEEREQGEQEDTD